ncbi:MAG: adenylate/guanylate cyclase domain-containing protein [Chitinophagaceae bacterium]
MGWIQKTLRITSPIARYRLRRILVISIAWMVIDLFLYLRNVTSGSDIDYPYQEISLTACLLRASIVLISGFLMSWLLLKELKIVFRNKTLLTGWLIKVFLLLLMALAVNALIFFFHFLIIKGVNFTETISQFESFFLHTNIVTNSLLFWLIVLLSAQIVVEIDQKYSPGVFWEILTGKYLKPRNEKRIIMFLDLKDSTPIAEQLGHEKYFLFIRDFIYYVSKAVLENNGMIYQYVGDEVVVTWPYNKQNILKSVNTVIESRRAIQRKADHFRREYNDIVPEFRVGLHAGEVTIGEIGIIKKDIAISGEAMNTAARIRSACNELNQKFIVSKEYFDTGIFKSWQGENLGEVSLKGMDESIELYALKI